MNITTSEILPTSHGHYTCELLINGDWQGDLYGDTEQELKSLCLAICAIPELTKANEAYIALGNMKHSLAGDFEVKSQEVERLMNEANEKLNGK